MVVTFEDPSLGEWEAAGAKPLTSAQRRAWVKQALVLQQKRLDALGAAGVQFRVEHRYIRVVNGVSITVHGDGAQLLHAVHGVASIAPVRTLWPTAIGAGSAATGATAVAAAQQASVEGRVRIAVLDTGIDAAHPAVAGHVDAAHDATGIDGTKQGPITPDAHGTAVAGVALRSAGTQADAVIVPIRILASTPTRDGDEAILGTSDDLLAGLEQAVDPNADGDTSDRADVALIASTSPYAGFTDSPEERAVRAADALGTVVVAAAGNDGASGDEVGTVGSVAAADAALTVGAVDLRGRTPGADVRVRGGGIDDTFEGVPVLTAAGSSQLPRAAKLPVIAIDGVGDEVADYLDSELRSRVTGAVVLLAARDGVTVHDQIRAAADAGAVGVLVGARGASAAAGTIDVDGADIPAIGIPLDNARAIHHVLRGGEGLTVSLTRADERNPAFGDVAGFSSAGPRMDGVARPDVLAPGVGMVVAGDRATGMAWRTVSGTSISAAWAAGEVAALRAERPEWDAATVRAAVLGTAIPLGEVGERPPVSAQGAGVLDADRAAAVSWLSGAGRIDFGSVAPGGEARRALAIHPLLASLGIDPADASPQIQLDDGGAASKVTPMLSNGELVVNVPDGTRAGRVGGWLVLPDLDIRIPWTLTVRDFVAATVPLDAQLSSDTLQAVAGPGAFASNLTIGIGGDASNAGALGLAAVQRLEVRIFDAAGKDHGSIGGLDQALPGVYNFGLTGVGADGKRLQAGAWELRLRYVPATDPSGEWRTGPVLPISVEPAPKG